MSLRDRMINSMHPRHDQPFPYPDLPQSLRPRDDEQNQNPIIVHTTLPYHTPYLGFRARLSQIWFNRWTVLLMLIVIRVLILTWTMDDDLEGGRVRALSACTGVESMGSAMASMPHYMARGVNEAAAQGIEAAVRGLQKTLFLGLDAVEAIVIFFINVIVQTYICLLTFAIRSSLGTVLEAATQITEFLDKTLGEITDEVQEQAKSFTDVVNKLVGSLNGIGNFFGDGGSIPELELPSLDKLDNIQIPDRVFQDLKKLNDSIPTFNQVDTMYKAALSVPFSLIRSQMNNSLSVYQFNRQVLPVPEKTTLTFCSDNPAISNFFNDITELVQKTRNIILGVVIALAVIVMVPMAYRQYWRYRTLRQRAYMLTTSGQSFDPVDIVTISTRPFSSTLGLKAAAWFKSPRKQVLIRWWFAYVSTPSCLFVLSLGIAGLLSCLGQYIVLRQIVQRTPELADQVGQFADIVVTQLTDSSLAWSNDANGVVIEMQDNVNDEVFGWVHNGTLALNNTLNDFVDTMQDGIGDVFNGTPLEEPIRNIFFCLVELKIKGIQKGLTWAHENSKVAFPLFPNDTFSLGAAESVGPDAESGSQSFLADSGSEAADKITEVVVQLAAKWEQGLLIETYICCGLIGIWVLVCIIGAIRIGILMLSKDKTRGEGAGYTGDGRAGFSPKGDERINPVFPQFEEKSDPDLARHHQERYGEASSSTEYERDYPAAVASPRRTGYSKGTGWNTRSHQGEVVI